MNLTLTLAVADLERTEDFYRNLLQQPIERLSPGKGLPELLLLMFDGSDVLFRQDNNLTASHPALFQNLNRHPKGVGVVLELTFADLDPISHKLDRQEQHLLYELQDDEHRRRELWLHDPDGYLLILTQEPAPAERKDAIA
jgi:catechol 2,3-dioxygenase-like lactoylglutathione lyase family enzyme